MSRNHVRPPDAPKRDYAYRSELPLENVLGIVTDAFTGAQCSACSNLASNL
jgi:hypothetical protein